MYIKDTVSRSRQILNQTSVHVGQLVTLRVDSMNAWQWLMEKAVGAILVQTK